MKNFRSILMMIVGVIIIALGIIILANLPPVHGWTEFHSFSKEYGPNTEIIIGTIISILGVVLMILSVKTDK